MSGNAAIELKNITKTFGPIVANKDVCLTVNRGEILSILGENGSGKTTLMNMISGIYFPDHGQIFIDGEEVVIRSPKDAFDYKIGMIHQHFKLVDVFSATENIILGLEQKGNFNLKEAAAEVKKISEKYGFEIEMDDFGSGYSTLNMLVERPVDEVKFDRGFLFHLENPKYRTLLSHTIHMLHDLGLPIIIEGVETESQKNLLLEWGCKQAQGFLFYKPMPVEDFKELLIKQKQQEQ